MRRGFTLLETMVATALSAVLMAGLWAMFGTFEKLFSSGQAKVEEAQLARSLLDQIAADLQSAIPDSVAPVPGSTSSLRRFGLFGAQRGLQVDVLQVTASQLLARFQSESGPSDRRRQDRVPELHTVQYLFEPSEPTEPGGADSLDSPLPPSRRTGLVRRQLDWELPEGEDGPRPRRGRLATGESSLASGGADPMDISFESAEPESPDLLHVPEVANLEFRYWDGSSWVSQWNSLQRKSLPVAVEVALTLRREETKRGQPTAPSMEEPIDSAVPSQTGDSQPVHRLLVFLPSTALAHAPSPRSALRDSLPPAPEIRPAPSPRLLPAPPQPAGGSLRSVLSDQWMRSGS